MNSWIISGAIGISGFLIFLSLLLRNKWKANRKNIDDYQVKRDRIGKEESNEGLEDISSEENSGGLLSNIIGGFVVVLIGTSLINPLIENLDSASSNIAGMSETLLGIVPIFFTITIVVIALAMVSNAFMGTGLI